MSATLWIVVLWMVFAGTHMALSSLTLRPRLVRVFGAKGFQGVYSLIAVVAFTTLVWVYLLNRHQGPLLWTISVGTAGLWGIYLLQGVAWSLIVAGLVQPSPALPVPEERRNTEVRGAHRITRHPLLMGLGLFGALHLPFMGWTSDVAFWAGFPLFALIGGAHQDRRKAATEGEGFRAWLAATPFLPFTGRETLRGLREFPPLAVGLGVVVATGLRLLHGPLFR